MRFFRSTLVRCIFLLLASLNFYLLLGIEQIELHSVSRYRLPSVSPTEGDQAAAMM